MRRAPWEEWLGRAGGYAEAYPAEAKAILHAVEHGISVDFVGVRTHPVHGRNPPVTPDIAQKVSAIIAADVVALKKAGPFATPPYANFFVSPIGAVVKAGTEKIRVIHNLSYPFGGESVNEGVVEVKYTLDSFDVAAEAVVRLGRGCFLVKLDVEAAYKQVAVRPEDWHLLGFQWLNEYYYERVLPFGLRSSCRLWDWFAAALHYFFEKHLFIDVVIHYVDDFLFVVKVREQAEEKLRFALTLCRALGIPMAAKKTEGPCTKLTFLGLELDTLEMRAALPAPKLHELRQLAEVWLKKETATVKELQSLIGKLTFATKVVRPGKIYLTRLQGQLRRMLAKEAPSSKAQWTLPAVCKEDVRWWHQLMERWNGISLLYELEWVHANGVALSLATDACERGYGAVCGDEWFEGEWTELQRATAFRNKKESMPFYELHALVQAAATWSHRWAGKRIIFLTDCEANVKAIQHQRSREAHTAHLLRTLTDIACMRGFEYKVRHIPGVTNIAADALSRHGDCQQFRADRPNAHALPTPPAPLALLPLSSPALPPAGI
jgi:hypothetical protein